MNENNTAAHGCVDCGVAVTRRGHARPPKRCTGCRRVFQRERERARRTHLTGMLPFLNKRPSAEVASDAERRVLEPGYVRDSTRPAICATCAKPFVASTRGPLPSWCPPCRRERHLARRRDKSAPFVREPIRCRDCGVEFTPNVKGRPSKRCKPCRDARGYRARQEWRKLNPERDLVWSRAARQVRKARKMALPAESIKSAEIFERDGWRCGICKKRINKRLKYPHPKSGSLDHVIPLSEGGHHVRSNVRASHLDCNVRRGNRGGGEQLTLVG
ncbi:HNH endonuclease [Micromonospora tulbaghiae]|uniref:HNH endonuclease n=1 Tax=Micromonospora tulbaghiae TaxID=479978 RepID=UPI003411CB17